MNVFFSLNQTKPMFMIRVLFVLSVALVDDEDHYCGVSLLAGNGWMVIGIGQVTYEAVSYHEHEQ